MTNYFIDSAIGDDTDDGTTMDAGGGGGTGAWATIEHALEAGGLTAGDIVWVRRTHEEVGLASHIDAAYSGTIDNPVTLSGWPRAVETGITSATWTNGSTTVDDVVGISIDLESHLGRFIVGPDGFNYLITLVTDSNTFTIDREYVSATVSSTDGAATILEDENYDTAQAIDAAYATEKTAWNADADDMATLDFNNAGFAIRLSGDIHWYFRNMYIRDNNSGSGLINNNTIGTRMKGCLLWHGANYAVLQGNQGGTYHLERCIVWGDGAGSGQRGLQTVGTWHIKDCAIYQTGDNGLLLIEGGYTYLDNVNIGVEGNCGDYDIFAGWGHTVFGKDVKLGANIGALTISYALPHHRCSFENYNKVLGAHKTFNGHGEVTSVDVVAGSGDPYKRTGGADKVVEILYNINDTAARSTNSQIPSAFFEHEFETNTDTKSYRYYVQAEGIVTASELWIECEYVSAYDDTSKYILTKVTSDEAFTARADAEDWAEYMEVTGITPAVDSKVRIKCYCSYYHPTNKIYIDPSVVVS